MACNKILEWSNLQMSIMSMVFPFVPHGLSLSDMTRGYLEHQTVDVGLLLCCGFSGQNSSTDMRWYQGGKIWVEKRTKNWADERRKTHDLLWLLVLHSAKDFSSWCFQIWYLRRNDPIWKHFFNHQAFVLAVLVLEIHFFRWNSSWLTGKFPHVFIDVVEVFQRIDGRNKHFSWPKKSHGKPNGDGPRSLASPNSASLILKDLMYPSCHSLMMFSSYR